MTVLTLPSSLAQAYPDAKRQYQRGHNNCASHAQDSLLPARSAKTLPVPGMRRGSATVHDSLPPSLERRIWPASSAMHEHDGGRPLSALRLD